MSGVLRSDHCRSAFNFPSQGKRCLLLLIAILLVATRSIQGTTIPRMNLPELVKGADRILQGTVETIEVQFDERLKLPFTWVRVRVADPIKGDRRQTIFLKHVGGKIPGSRYTVSVAGTPQFHQGDNVLVFLQRIPDSTDTYQVLGMKQGKYDVIDEVAVAEISGIELVDSKTGRKLPSAFTERAPIEALKAKIRELLQ